MVTSKPAWSRYFAEQRPLAPAPIMAIFLVPRRFGPIGGPPRPRWYTDCTSVIRLVSSQVSLGALLMVPGVICKIRKVVCRCVVTRGRHGCCGHLPSHGLPG